MLIAEKDHLVGVNGGKNFVELALGERFGEINAENFRTDIQRERVDDDGLELLWSPDCIQGGGVHGDGKSTSSALMGAGSLTFLSG